MQPISKRVFFKIKDIKHPPVAFTPMAKIEDSGAAMTFAKHLPAKSQKCIGEKLQYKIKAQISWGGLC